MGFAKGLIDKILNNKKMAIIIAAIVAAVVIAFVVFLIASTTGAGSGDGSGNGDKDSEYAVATVDVVHMERNLTAAGKVTTGEKQTVSLAKGKILKALSVSTNEAVARGQALAYYTDGTHTDAPMDCIITGIHAPKNGETITDSHSIAYSDTNDLYLKVTVPEDEINNVSQGDTAQITINARPNKTYSGEIIEKKDVSTTLLTEIQNNKKENEKEDSSEDEEESEDDSDEEESGDEDSEEDTPDLDAEEDVESEDGEEDGSGGGSLSYYSVNIRFENDGTIKPGMSAYCTISIQSRDDVLSVPVQAVYFDETGKAFVYMENAKEGEKTYVKIGSSDAMNAEIVSGLKKGDKIRYDKY